MIGGIDFSLSSLFSLQSPPSLLDLGGGSGRDRSASGGGGGGGRSLLPVGHRRRRFDHRPLLMLLRLLRLATSRLRPVVLKEEVRICEF